MEFREMLKGSNVVKNGHFLLTSGRHSNVYINKDAIFSNPRLFRCIKDFIIDQIERSNCHYDVITGPALAGAILAAPISIATELIFVYPEKIQISPYYQSKKEYKMEFRRGYDKIISGKRVLLIEDIITTGKSVQQTIDAISECGGMVTDVISIWNRSGWAPKICNIFSVINDPIISWHKDACPNCKNGVLLTDPKTDEVIKQ